MSEQSDVIPGGTEADLQGQRASAGAGAASMAAAGEGTGGSEADRQEQDTPSTSVPPAVVWASLAKGQAARKPIAWSRPRTCRSMPRTPSRTGAGTTPGPDVVGPGVLTG
ncbi:hypothetical protein IWX63_002274 [Arthrobacter sp. CAN_A2]|uniref:hypothetical protein n=1 Tax=Arthrobacter sp. CAN_A2 TaxID=2787718 RepID=UPI0018F048E7